ncbi:MAG: hypothetical protein NT163_05670 [Chlorobiales bacterium]|nr:hypothetical protein [Chlorobiales bacterium]
MNKAIRSIAVLMLFGMLLQINCVFVCYGLFFLNQKAIAENVCEKKTKDCCGQCFLHKKIAVTSDTQSASTEKQVPTKTMVKLLHAMPGLLTNIQHTPLTASSGKRFTSSHASFLLDGVMRQIDYPPNTELQLSQLNA